MATQKLRADTAKQTLHYGPFGLVTGATRTLKDAAIVKPGDPS